MLENIGKYKVNGLIAKGASSRVYLAQDPNLSTQVAIKVFDGEKPTLTSTSDFIAQSKILHRLSCAAHIISFMEFDFTESKQAYIVMPYVKRSLADVLGDTNKLSIRNTLQISQQILVGLSHIHEAGLLHLDIKPANILVDDREQIQITDFGISCETRSKGTKSNDSMTLQYGAGSLHFASPEQLLSANNTSVQSDLFAVGAIMFRCLTGTHWDVVRQPANQLTSNISDVLNDLLLSALSEQVKMRPKSALAFLAIVNKELESLACETIDPAATRVWDNTNDNDSPLSVLHKNIRGQLLKEGEISLVHFDRFALLAKTQLHERYSNEWLHQYISQTKSQLSKTDCNAAALFLWIEEIDKAMALNLAKGEGAPIDSEHLMTLGKLSLHIPDDDISRLLANKLAQQSSARVSQKHSSMRRTQWRLIAAIIIVVSAILLPWWFHHNRDNEATTIEAPAALFAIDESEHDSVDSQSVNIEPIAHNLAPPLVRLILQVQPKNADVVLQSMSGVAVEHNAITNGDYWLRVSKNGYKTLSKKISINTNEYLVNERLELSDSRYFIGSTERSVADGIPIEFILLPSPQGGNEMEAKNASSNRIRMMSFEVTNALYSECVNEGKCARSTKLSTDPRRKTFLSPQHPAINVSWFDITEQFIPWLASKTNSQLRLPTKHEWEFAAAASSNASTTRYSWGEFREYGRAHCKNCNTNISQNTSMPVKSFPANTWQIFDMHGNVQEWTSTCPQSDRLLPSSTIALRCDLAIVKGGSWLSQLSDISILRDDSLRKTARSHTTGFRLVEEVNE